VATWLRCEFRNSYCIVAAYPQALSFQSGISDDGNGVCVWCCGCYLCFWGDGNGVEMGRSRTDSAGVFVCDEMRVQGPVDRAELI